MKVSFLATSCVVSCLSFFAANVRAEAASDPRLDSSGSESAADKHPDTRPPEERFRGSSLGLDNSVSAQTLGVGADYQSRNPVYELSFVLRPRYYVWEEAGVRSVALSGNLALVGELTNSDSTTEEHEWSPTDTDIQLSYAERLVDADEFQTDLLVGLPVVSLPTSPASRNNGKIMGLGANVGVTETLPLRAHEKFLPAGRVRARTGYSYQFTRAIVPTNDEIARIRLFPDGRSSPSDQLGSAPFAQHQVTLEVAGGLDITDVITLDTVLGWRPAWGYSLKSDVEVCGVVLTGCATARSVDDPTSLSVVSVFQTELAIGVPRPFGFALGYENIALQLGPDGERRNMLYSPDARFYLSVLLRVDELLAGSQQGRKELARALPPTLE